MRRDQYKIGIILFGIQLLLMSILVYGGIINQIGSFRQYPLPLLLVLGIAVLILCIVSIFVIRSLFISSIRTRQQEVELLRLKYIEEQNRLHRQYRHDLYNHLTVISGLAQLGKTEQLLQYLESYLGIMNQSVMTIFSGLKELDVLLYSKLVSAKNHAVELSIQCLVHLICNQNYVVQIISILANALDNAIEAAANADGEKRVDLVISGDNKNYIFDITNTFQAGINFAQGVNVDGFTTKLKGKGGQGISIMRRGVDYLKGTMNYSISDGFCHLHIESPKSILEGTR